MKDLNQIESQLRSWSPRRPSATLKQRVFPARTTLPAFPAFAIGRWLAPAMTIFALGLVYVQNNPDYLGSIQSSPSVELMASAQTSHSHLATCFAAASPGDRNVWSVTTFDSTNAGQSLSTTASDLRRNVLMH